MSKQKSQSALRGQYVVEISSADGRSYVADLTDASSFHLHYDERTQARTLSANVAGVFSAGSVVQLAGRLSWTLGGVGPDGAVYERISAGTFALDGVPLDTTPCDAVSPSLYVESHTTKKYTSTGAAPASLYYERISSCQARLVMFVVVLNDGDQPYAFPDDLLCSLPAEPSPPLLSVTDEQQDDSVESAGAARGHRAGYYGHPHRYGGGPRVSVRNYRRGYPHGVGHYPVRLRTWPYIPYIVPPWAVGPFSLGRGGVIYRPGGPYPPTAYVY